MFPGGHAGRQGAVHPPRRPHSPCRQAGKSTGSPNPGQLSSKTIAPVTRAAHITCMTLPNPNPKPFLARRTQPHSALLGEATSSQDSLPNTANVCCRAAACCCCRTTSRDPSCGSCATWTSRPRRRRRPRRPPPSRRVCRRRCTCDTPLPSTHRAAQRFAAMLGHAGRGAAQAAA